MNPGKNEKQATAAPKGRRSIERVLGRIHRRVLGGASLEEIIDSLFKEIRSIVPCDRIDIAFIEEGGTRLLLHHTRAKYASLLLLPGFASDIVGSAVHAVFLRGKNRIIRDFSQYLKKYPESESAKLLLKEGIHSSMACPFYADRRPIGLIFCRAKEPGAYTAIEVRLLGKIAESIGYALEKAYHIDRLTDALHGYLEMLSFVSHEMKSPLSSIITLGNTLLSGYFGPVNPDCIDKVERMVRKAEYLHTISEKYLNLSRFETGNFDAYPRSVDFVGEVLNPAIEIVHPQIEAHTIDFLIECPAELSTITCDPELMRIVMVNLVNNAVKYGNPGGMVTVTAAKTPNKRLRVIVWNEGPGFSDGEKIRLFKKFSRLDSPHLKDRKGSGIGLYLSWHIIQLHGGKIWAESEPGSWARFSFEIPQDLDFCIID